MFDHTKFYDKKVLFVRPEHGGTYLVICDGIIEALRKLVSLVYVTDANNNVAYLATKYKVDLVLVLLGDTLPVYQVAEIVKQGIKTAVWFTDDPYYTDVTSTYAHFYHYVFTQEVSCVPFYRQLGCHNVYHLPLAANTKYFHHQKKANSYLFDVCFLGTGWNNRIVLFNEIASYLSTKKTLIVGPNWNKMKNYHLLQDKIRLEGLSPEESAHLMNCSKIVINHHRSHNDNTLFKKNSNQLPAYSVNPRTFEISACGAFQLTDIRRDLPQHYAIGKEIETYSSSLELIQKIEYYLKNDKERNAIAERGLKKTLNNHTYMNRVTTLLKTIFG